MTRLILAFGLAFTIWPATHSHGEDWVRFRGPRADGISVETEWMGTWGDDGPPIAWKANVSTGFSSVVVSQGRLYTMGNEENVDIVSCLDVDSGKLLWTHRYPCAGDPNEFEGGPTSTPTVDGDQLYTLSRRGDLIRLDCQTGEVQWSINVANKADVRVPAWGFSGAPLVVGDQLILNVGDAGVSVDKNSGELVWASADKDAGYATPVVVPGDGPPSVLIGSARSYVCVDVSSGEERWRERWLTTFGCNAADPLFRNRQVFLCSGYNRGGAVLDLSGESPTRVWKSKEMQNQISTSLLIEDHLYGVHGDVDAGAKLRCLHWETGEVKWSCEEFRAGAVSAAGTRLIAVSDTGELVIGEASPDSFRILARHEVMQEKCWTVPVLSGGRIYVRGAEGTLVCVDVR